MIQHVNKYPIYSIFDRDANFCTQCSYKEIAGTGD